MAYTSPELTLIGCAAGLVLGWVDIGPDDPAKPNNSDLARYDVREQL